MNSKLINFILQSISKSSRFLYRDYYELEMQQSSKFISQDFIKRSFDKCQERLIAELPNYEEKLKFEIIPIEGKDNFAHAIPFFAIVVVAYKEGADMPQAAVIDFPALGLSYFAENGDSAWALEHTNEMHNGSRRLKAAKRETGLLYISDNELNAPEGSITRNFGSIAYSICMVASGKADIASFKDPHPTLVKAARLFMQEAGGKMVSENPLILLNNSAKLFP